MGYDWTEICIKVITQCNGFGEEAITHYLRPIPMKSWCATCMSNIGLLASDKTANDALFKARAIKSNFGFYGPARSVLYFV